MPRAVPNAIGLVAALLVAGSPSTARTCNGFCSGWRSITPIFPETVPAGGVLAFAFTGERAVGSPICPEPALEATLGPVELDPAAALAAHCVGEPYSCEVDGWTWDDRECSPWSGGASAAAGDHDSGEAAQGHGCAVGERHGPWMLVVVCGALMGRRRRFATSRMGRPRVWLAALAAVVTLAACSAGGDVGGGATTTTSTASTAATTTTDGCVDTSTSAGTTGGYGAGFSSLGDTWETTTTSTTDATDFLALDACPFAEPCAPFLYQAVESGGDPSHETHLEVERCILEGLREGVPGRYRHTIVTMTFANGSVADALFEVRSDRSLSVTWYTNKVSTGSMDAVYVEAYELAQSCVLAPPEFFAACLDTHTSWGDPPDCMRSVKGWWSGCVADEVSCPCDGDAAGGAARAPGHRPWRGR